MDAEILSELINKDAVLDQADHCAKLIGVGDGSVSTGPVDEREWKAALVRLSQLDCETKKSILCFCRQTSVDAVSVVLGILDGSSILDDYRDEFKLVYGDSTGLLNGDLQTYFLALNEVGRK